MSAVRVAVLADDLIWATRLTGLVEAAGARGVPCRTAADLERLLSSVDAVVVDLAGRGFDPLAAIAAVGARGRVLAVGPHDDAEARQGARDAGAERVLAYRALAEDGAAAIGLWLAADPRGGPPRPVDAAPPVRR